MFDAPNQTAAECFSAIRTISAFNAGVYVTDMYRKQLQAPTAAIGKTAQVSGLGFAFSQGIMFWVSIPFSSSCYLLRSRSGIVWLMP